MRKTKIILCLYLMLMLCLTQLFTLSATASSIELIPTEDSYIDYNDPSTNFNSDPEDYLSVWGVICYDTTCFGCKTYLKFGLSEIPSAAAINSAELKLYLYSDNLDTSQPCSIDIFYCPDNSWEENLINWNNAPSYDNSTPIDTCYGIAFEGWYKWTVTSAVTQALSSGTLTLVLEDDENGEISDFYSRESYWSDEWEDQRPRLNISYTLEQPNTPPTAGFSYSPSNPMVNDTIQFTDTSTDSDGTIASWSWNFGDGTSSTSKNPQHRFSANGTFTVSLEVTDNVGGTDTFSKAISVGGSGAASTSTGKGTPGFELIFVVSAMALVLFLKRRRIKL